MQLELQNVADEKPQAMTVDYDEPVKTWAAETQ